MGGIAAVMGGGKFGHGFFAAGVTKGLGGKYLPSGSNLSGQEIAGGTVSYCLCGFSPSVATSLAAPFVTGVPGVALSVVDATLTVTGN